MLILTAATWWVVLWFLGSRIMRLASFGALVTVVACIALGRSCHSYNDEIAAYTTAVLAAVQGVALWVGGHYKFLRKHGYWKSTLLRFLASRRRTAPAPMPSPYQQSYPYPVQQYAYPPQRGPILDRR